MGIEMTKLAIIALATLDSANPLTVPTLTDKALADAGVESGITVKGLRAQSDRIMVKVGAYVDLYEKSAKEDKENVQGMLDEAASDLAKEMAGWFRNFGSRDPKDRKNPKAKRRPLFNICQANYVQLGEMLKGATSDSFFEQLMLCTARMLNGQPFGRVSEADIRKSRKGWNTQSAEKSKATRQANAVKAEQERQAKEQAAAEEARKQKELEQLRQQNEKLKADLEAEKNKPTTTVPTTNEGKSNGNKNRKKDVVVDLASTLFAIQHSSATEEEKNIIIDNLMTALKAANIKTVSDPTIEK